MAASEGIIGYGTILSVEDAPGSGVFVPLAEITNITAPNKSADQVERTHMTSPGRTKEFTQGLIDPGDSTYKLNHIPGSATDDFILAWEAAGVPRSTKISWTTGVFDTFPSFVKGYAPDDFDASGLIKSTLTVKVAGEVVRT